jgi:hypothetical protein
MTPATDTSRTSRPNWAATRSKTLLGYPVASVVVGVARNQDDRVTTGRDEDRAAR